MASGPRGPLHGIPYSLKDIFDVAGVRTTAQSRLLASNVPVEDSACAAKLEAAGAILQPRSRRLGCAAGPTRMTWTWKSKKALMSQGFLLLGRPLADLTGLLLGGERGIRTLDAGFCPHTPLAGEHLRPLGHRSGAWDDTARRLDGSRFAGQFPISRQRAGRGRTRGAARAPRAPCTSRRSRRRS